MKKWTWVVGIVGVLVLGYLGGIGYYSNKFQPNTKIGVIDISNLTLPQAQVKIEQDIANTKLEVKENGRDIGTLTVKDLNGDIDTTEELTAIFNNQDPRFWIVSLFKSSKYEDTLADNVAISDVTLSENLDKLGLSNESRTPAQNAQVKYDDKKGYYVEKEKSGNQLDLEKVKTMILDRIQKGEQSIDIKTSYLEPTVTENDEKVTNIMKSIDNITKPKVTLTIAGNDVTIPKEEIMKWVYFDDQNQVVLDQESAQEYVRSLNEKYATYNKVRQFHSTLQGTVEVQPGTLGWSIDSEEEAKQIIEDLNAGKDVKRDPYIVGTGYSETTGDDIGNSYVEVDITNQTMFIYVNGEQVLQTPVVTGRPGTTTVPGAYAAWNKEENAELKGYNQHTQQDYTQPVSYWIPFDDTGQGIHDANWQSNFGGSTYLQAGSLGCINVPPGVMPSVFDSISLGMPVIVF